MWENGFIILKTTLDFESLFIFCLCRADLDPKEKLTSQLFLRLCGFRCSDPL